MKSFKEQLMKWTMMHAQPAIMKRQPLTPKRQRKESLSQRDLRELMGTCRPTYARKRGGAYRQR